ncbi:MAG: dehydrogenase [Verrucomicrobiales bacterium]|nr:dehydrogenase [Verrucomicrobiales bacterium]
MIRADGTEISLAELTPSVVRGELLKDTTVGGKTLKILRTTYKRGFGTTGPCLMGFQLPGPFVRLYIKAGIDIAADPHTTTKPQSEVPADAPKIEFVAFTAKPDVAFLKKPFDTTQRYGLAAAQASLRDFKVADGLDVSLFACEPMVRNPTDMDIDARGRVWVCEGVNYRSTFQPWGVLRPAGDRIVILEDTDGNGLADKETTFYQGPDINSALGVCVLGNKAIVSCSPNVFVFTDTDGDGTADKKEVLFRGVSGVDHDHGVHAFTFGPDGKLYFNFGNESKQIKRPDGSPVIDTEGREVAAIGKPFRNGMVLRCNVDGSEVEVLGYNFRNPYEACVDAFGTVWQSDNDDDGNRAVRVEYIMEHGNFGFYDELTGAGWGQKRSNMEEETPLRHWHQNDPGVVPNLLLTGAGAPTGIAIYEGKLLPKQFQNQMILCDAGTRLVRSYPVQDEGAGYKAKSIDILSSSDAWFRPSDVSVAPDGSIYVADWNDAGVGGHNMADREVATMTGRIYRVSPKGQKLVRVKYEFNTASQCMDALRSPNNSARYLAWTKLHEMKDKAEKALVKDWRGKDQRLRARALQLLARIPGKQEKYVDQAFADSNPNIRVAGLRIARSLKMDVTPYVEKLVADSNAQVRRECAIALRHNESERAAELWARLALQHDGRDRWYLEALGIGADGNQEKFFAAWVKKTGDQWNTASGRDIIWRSRAPSSAMYLALIISDAKTSDVERARCFRAFDFIPACDQKQQALVQLLARATN